jgi:type VII secretion-associated serine protease mycosin
VRTLKKELKHFSSEPFMKRCILVAILATTLSLSPAAALARSIAEPNDPYYPDQWALAHIGAPCAWARTIGSPDVTVAVVDSGVDMGHPDLVDRLRDDGRDFVDGDDDPSDENGHGTNVAGIIAATIDNGEGGAGMAPGIKILPVRVMNARGAGSDRSIARGIRYAADKGAQVINLSLGATLTIDADTVSELVTSAIRYAQDKGALVIVAAGNDFLPLENAIVGENPDVLVVAATDQNDVKADFSNSGPWIGITAPGVHILSTMPTYDVYLTSQVPREERFRKNYDYMTGTSQATPLVSGLAALIFSAHPDWDAHQVEQAIKARAADISRQNATLARQGFLGSGRIDACQALGEDLGAAPTAAAPAAPTPMPEFGAPGAPTPTAARPTPRPTAAPEVIAVPEPLETTPAARIQLGRSLLVIGAGLGCGAILLFVFLLFVLVRAFRRPAGKPAAVPVYGPPPVAVPALPPSAWGQLSVIAGPALARAYPVGGSGALIGRGEDCAVMLLGDGTVSRRHALIRGDGRRVTLEDAGSTHGTYVGGQRVTAAVAIRRGDVIQVGQTLLRFE